MLCAANEIGAYLLGQREIVAPRLVGVLERGAAPPVLHARVQRHDFRNLALSPRSPQKAVWSCRSRRVINVVGEGRQISGRASDIRRRLREAEVELAATRATD